MRSIALLPCLLLLSLLGSPALGASYIESIDGNLSDDPMAPTSLILDPGANMVVGGVSIPTGLDYLTISVPAGHALTAIEPTSFAGTVVAFLGLQTGSEWTAGEFFDIDAALLLGWAHFGGADLGTNILPAIGMGQGAQGFTGPLAAGDYTILLQETGVVEVDYGLELTVASVPEAMGTGWALLAALSGLSAASRRSRCTR